MLEFELLRNLSYSWIFIRFFRYIIISYLLLRMKRKQKYISNIYYSLRLLVVPQRLAPAVLCGAGCIVNCM